MKRCKTCSSHLGPHRCAGCRLEVYCGPECQRSDRRNHRGNCHGMQEFNALPGVMEGGLHFIVWGVLGEKWARRRGPRGLGLDAADRAIPRGEVVAFIAGPLLPDGQPASFEQHRFLFDNTLAHPDFILPRDVNASAIEDSISDATKRLLARGALTEGLLAYCTDAVTCNAAACRDYANPAVLPVKTTRDVAPGERLTIPYGMRHWAERVAGGCLRGTTFRGAWLANMLILRGDQHVYEALLHRHSIPREDAAKFLKDVLGADTGCVPVWLTDAGASVAFCGVGGETCHSPSVGAGDPQLICVGPGRAAAGMAVYLLGSIADYARMACDTELLIARRLAPLIADDADRAYARRVVGDNLRELYGIYELPAWEINGLLTEVFGAAPPPAPPAPHASHGPEPP